LTKERSWWYGIKILYATVAVPVKELVEKKVNI
jgi:hypothetical protein